jgi:outer membrane protein assembly factor BamB
MPETEHRTLKILLLLGILSPLLWQGYRSLNRYLEDSETQLFAIDIPTGKVKWRTTLPNAQDKSYSAPITLSNDRILITQFPHWKTVKEQCGWIEFDRQSGNIVGRYDAKKLGLQGCPAPHIPPVAENSKLYTFWRNSINEGESSEQGIAAIDFKTRQLQWNLPIQLRWRDSSDDKSLLMTDGKLIAVVSDTDQKQYGTTLKALDPKTGTILWKDQRDGLARDLSSRFSHNQLALHAKSIIFYTVAKNQEKWLGQWLEYNLNTGKPIAAYANNTQSSSQDISEIFQKDGQLYALISREESREVVRRSIARVKLADGTFTLDKQSPNLSTDSICPKLNNLHPTRNTVVASCMRESGTQNFFIKAIDMGTYKPKWWLESSSLSNVISNPTSDQILVVDSSEIQAVSNTDGKVQWSLYRTDRNVTVDGDTLFVTIDVPRKQLRDFNPFKPN